MYPWPVAVVATATALLVALLRPVGAYYLREYPPTVYADVVTKQLTSQKFVDVTCTASDWGPSATANTFAVDAADGSTTYDVSVRCLPPTYIYDLIPTGYIPRDGVLSITEFCRTSPASVTNTTYADVVRNAALPTAVSRRLLGFDFGGFLKKFACSGGAGMIPLGGRGGINPYAQAASVGVATFQTFAPGCEPDDPSAETMKQLNDLRAQLAQAGENLTKATKDLWSNVSQTWAITSDFMHNQTLINNLTLAAIQLNVQNGLVTWNRTDSIIQQVNSLSNTVARDLEQARQWHLEANSQIQAANDAISVLSQSTDAGLRAVAAQLQNATASLAQSIAGVTDRVEENRVDSLKQAVAIAAQLRRLTGITQRAATRSQDRRVFTRRVLAEIAATQAAGYVPFLPDLGTEPVVDANDFNLPIEELYVRTMYGSTAYQDKFTVMCDGNFIADGLGSWQSPDDVVTAIGPPNCTTIDQNNDRCRCFAFVTTSYCLAASALVADSGASTYFTKDTSVWQTERALVDTLHCQGGAGTITTGDTALLTSIDEFAAAVAAVAGHTVDQGEATYVVAAKYTGLRVVLPYRAALVNTTAFALLQTRDEAELGRALARFVGASAGRFAALSDAVYAAADGIIAGGVSFEEAPFSASGGVPAQCTRAMFMSYTPDWIPQYRLRVRSVQLNMLATITNRINPADVREVNFTDLTYTNALQMQLPGDILLAGSPFGTADGKIYDVEQRGLSTSPDVNARAGTVSYALCANSYGCTYADFVNNTAQTFDARSGSNVAELYAHTLRWDATHGVYRCAPGQAGRSGPSSACDLRDRYDISPGDPLNTTLLAKPVYDGEYVVRFPVPMGDITQLIVTECPAITVQRTSPDGTMVRMTNPRAASVPMVLQYASDCCGTLPADTTVTVGPGAGVDVWVPAFVCTDTPACTQLAVYANVDTVPTLTPCVQTGGSGLDVSAEAREYTVGTLGIVDLTHVHRTASVATDYVLVALTKLNNDQTEIITDLMNLQYRATRLAGLPDTPELNFSAAFAAVAAKLANNSAAIAAARTGINGTNFSSYADDRAATDAEYAEQELRKAVLAAATQAALDAGRQLNSLQELNAERYDAAVNASNGAVQNFLLAQSTYLNLTDKMFGTIIHAFQEIIDGRTSWGDIGFDPSDLGVALIEAIAAAPGALAELAKELMPSFGLDGLPGVIIGIVVFIVIICSGCFLVCACLYGCYRLGLFKSISKGGSGRSFFGRTETRSADAEQPRQNSQRVRTGDLPDMDSERAPLAGGGGGAQTESRCAVM